MADTENKSGLTDEKLIEETSTEEAVDVEVEEEVSGEAEEIELTEEDVEDIAEAIVEKLEDDDERKVKDPWLMPTVVGFICLAFIIMVAALFTSESRTKQLNNLLKEVVNLKEQVAELQSEADNDVIVSYTGTIESAQSVTENGKTRYYVAIAGAGKFEVSEHIYLELKKYIGCTIDWFEHSTINEEGATIIWYDYDIQIYG